MTLAFRPSDVVLRAIPLANTMHRAERESAAAIIVRTCAALGNAWAPITLKQIAETIREDLATKREPITSLNANPFLRPDFVDLVEAGYASTFEDGSSIELTPKGFEAIAPWVRKDGTS